MLLLLFSFIQAPQVYTQIFPSDCYDDSLKIHQIKKALKKLSCRDDASFNSHIKHSFFLFKNFYNRRAESDHYCHILTFANFFDVLLIHGLNLEYDYAYYKPMSFSYSVEPSLRPHFDSLAAIQTKINRIVYKNSKTFTPFVKINQFYSEKILCSFEENSDIDLANIIDQIESCESLSYPQEVSTILRGRFRELTLEKYYDLTPKK